VNDNPETTVAANDAGGFQPVARLEDTSKGARPRPSTEDDDDEDEDSGGMRLYNAVYETALKQEIPRPLIAELIRIFANDVDFQRPVSASDSFEAFYEEGEDNDGRNELLYASITTRGETFRYYRFHTPDDGTLDYYDENGRSTRKFLIRKPIAIGEQRSTFGMRRHPILRYTRMHTGVDWSAPIGTPIFAAGNGVVTKAARESGYGNRVEIQHANGYVTTYNHLSGFARGISDGARVRQGQVIGFLGMTGLATGPHLHYEVMVNGHFVDPLRVRLARTRELDNRMLANFKRERDRIESLMAKAPNATRVAAARTDTRPGVQR
jgi:murein DD-endopeptidase MepM/ murein hydrolase activator NlpD